MIPIKDDNPSSKVPFVTIGLIAINILVFYYEVTTGYETVISRFGAIPERILAGRQIETAITSMFLHGGFLHLGSNMLYLWIFGDNIESYLGHFRYIIFYLVSGLAALAAHIYIGGVSDIPLVGASGAVSGILGGYLIKYPRANVLVVFPILIIWTIRRIPALFVLTFWFVMQLFSGFASYGATTGVAFWAHVGGFVAGVILVLLMGKKNRRRVSP